MRKVVFGSVPAPVECVQKNLKRNPFLFVELVVLQELPHQEPIAIDLSYFAVLSYDVPENPHILGGDGMSSFVNSSVLFAFPMLNYPESI